MIPIRELDAEGALKNRDIKPRNPNINDFLSSMEHIKPSVSPKELSRFEEWKDQFGG
jgi:hypothetical protein